MKILLFGGSGQLGFEILKRARALHFEVIAPVISELDITDREQVGFLCAKVRPDIVLNCAAYTAVDKAEEERSEAFRINADAAANVAQAAREAGAQLFHVSTDYVFSGTGSQPLKEGDSTGPINVYGESKLAGEVRVREIMGEGALVVRTSSLHGQHGVNFVHTMVKLMLERDVVKVVDDQFMSPTWAGWLAESMLDLCRLDKSQMASKAGGLVHASGAGVCSWYDFAQEIRGLIAPHVTVKARLEPISAAEFTRPARRPRYSAFDCGRLAMLLGRPPLGWRDGLRHHLAEINFGRAL